MSRHRLFVAGLVAAGVVSTTAPVALGDEVTLTTGETLVGEVVRDSDGQVVLDHPVLGELTLSKADVKEVIDDAADQQAESAEDRAEQQPPEKQAAKAQAPEEHAPAAEPERPFFTGWDMQISLGFSGTEGNSETRSVNAQFKATKENERHRWLFDNKYFYGSSGGETTQNEFTSSLTKDWLKPDSKWFYFAKGAYEYDEFEPWDHRASAFGGVGRDLIKRDDLALVGRLGLGVTKEFGDQADDLRPEALIGLELLRWNITENQNITGATTLYPDLGDLPENRVVSNIEWTADIAHGDGLALKLGVEHEYESETEGDADHNDIKYYGALTYDF